MKIVFVMTSVGYLRHYGATVEELARRGHKIVLAFDSDDDDTVPGSHRLKDELVAKYSNVESVAAPERELGPWPALARVIRLYVDYLRYFHPKYRSAQILRERMIGKIPAPFWGFLRVLMTVVPLPAGIFGRILKVIEQCIPVPREILGWLESERPDALLVTPLVYFGSRQVDYVKAAKRLGISNALCVASWDNLTNKGLMRVVPDRIFVWNRHQLEEAVEFHGAREDQVVITGAQTFDEWFGYRPTLDRAQFCQRVGLNPEKKIILYLCSSKFIAPHEASYVDRWIRTLRSVGDRELREAGILIRPHPKHLLQWEYFNEAQYENLSIWPRKNEGGVMDGEAKNDFFHSLYYSSAVVGVNTSALIEAGIVGRPVFSMLASEFSRTQQGTLHFHYLTDADDGLLSIARSMDEHVEQLSRALAAPVVFDRGRFIGSFVRPFGANVAGTRLLVEGIERMSGVKTAPLEMGWLAPVVAPILYQFGKICEYCWTRLKKQSHKGVVKYLLPDPKAGWVRQSLSVAARAWLAVELRRIGRRQKLAQEKAEGVLSVVERLRASALAAYMEGIRWSTSISTRGVRRLLGRSARWKRFLPSPLRRFLMAVPPWLCEMGSYGHAHPTGRDMNCMILGPWLGDVWTELYIWIPYLNWLKTKYALKENRLIVVSRGGTSAWYRNVTRQYLDAFDFVDRDELMRQLEEQCSNGGPYWQAKKSSCDQYVLTSLKKARKMALEELIHPRSMYRIFKEPLDNPSLQFLLPSYMRRFAPNPGLYKSNGAIAGMVRLPKEYIAVNFVFNEWLPGTPENHVFISNVLRALAQKFDVVLLGTDPQLKDRNDLSPDVAARVHRVGHLMAPSDHLSLKTSVLASAKALVGTYGDFTCISPLFGVNAFGIYSVKNRLKDGGLEMRRRVWAEWGLPPVTLVDAGRDGLGWLDAIPSFPLRESAVVGAS